MSLSENAFARNGSLLKNLDYVNLNVFYKRQAFIFRKIIWSCINNLIYI